MNSVEECDATKFSKSSLSSEIYTIIGNVLRGVVRGRLGESLALLSLMFRYTNARFSSEVVSIIELLLKNNLWNLQSR